MSPTQTITGFCSAVSIPKDQHCRRRLVAVFGELLLRLLVHLGVLLGIDQMSPCRLLALVVCRTLDLSPLLESTRGWSVV